eukprot:TRINITY_DN15997_c0_g1_i2.p1 TRINITY_DN15997_c0_g1~~TRINITY_DN15997_c0_g1_i2.p1  ORF type:complete len:387 (+),score=82.23 TRINITY_DN15997_c0_g1_i2:105-1163(+)
MAAGTEVTDWLECHRLGTYSAALAAEGYDDLADLAALAASEDEALCRLVPLEGHRRKIRRLLLGSSTASAGLASPAGPDPGQPSAASEAPSLIGGELASGSPCARSQSSSGLTAVSQTPSVPQGPVLPPTVSYSTFPAEGRFKVIVVGDVAAGKTSFIHRLVEKQFAPCMKPTIGIDFSEVRWRVRRDRFASVQLWDVSGQERFSNMTRAYYQGAHGAIVCFDRSSSGSLSRAMKWKHDIDQKVFVGGEVEGGVVIPCLLVATKCDLPDRTGATPERLEAACREHRFYGTFETSAKLDHNVTHAVDFLVRAMLKAVDAGPTSQTALPRYPSPRTSVSLQPRAKRASGGRCAC